MPTPNFPQSPNRGDKATANWADQVVDTLGRSFAGIVSRAGQIVYASANNALAVLNPPTVASKLIYSTRNNRPEWNRLVNLNIHTVSVAPGPQGSIAIIQGNFASGAGSAWQERTFQGATGYWIRMSWNAQLSDTAGQNIRTAGAEGFTKFRVGNADSQIVTALVMNKDESGSVDYRAPSALSIDNIATGKAVFFCASSRAGQLRMVYRLSQTASAMMLIDYWDGSSWQAVENLVDGSVNATHNDRSVGGGGIPTGLIITADITWGIPSSSADADYVANDGSTGRNPRIGDIFISNGTVWVHQPNGISI